MAIYTFFVKVMMASLVFCKAILDKILIFSTHRPSIPNLVGMCQVISDKRILNNLRLIYNLFAYCKNIAQQNVIQKYLEFNFLYL